MFYKIIFIYLIKNLQVHVFILVVKKYEFIIILNLNL